MSVQAYISTQPEPIREVMTVFRSWVRDLGSHVQEKLSNNIPVFEFYGPLCSINRTKDEGVEITFIKGSNLDDEMKILEAKGRKHSRSKTFYSIAELEEAEEQLRHLLNEAAILNEYHYKQRERKKKLKTK